MERRITLRSMEGESQQNLSQQQPAKSSRNSVSEYQSYSLFRVWPINWLFESNTSQWVEVRNASFNAHKQATWKVSACFFFVQNWKKREKIWRFHRKDLYLHRIIYFLCPKGSAVWLPAGHDFGIWFRIVERHNILAALTIILRSPEKPRKLIRNNRRQK